MFNPFVPNCGAYWRLNLTCLRVFCRWDPQKRLWDLTMLQGSRRTNMSIRNCNICNTGRTRYTTESTDVGCWLTPQTRKLIDIIKKCRNISKNLRETQPRPSQALYADICWSHFHPFPAGVANVSNRRGNLKSSLLDLSVRVENIKSCSKSNS